MNMNKMISDRYMIVTSLGEGGMADVYLAIDTILNREVAIKILRGELSGDPVTLLRFQREANAASKLNHPNVVDVYDVGECDGRHYIVMEYVRGRTLKQLISQRGALDKEEAVDIMIQLTSAVEEAHKNNIIHRDIKPQNVLVKDDGTVKITDFGIALAHDAVQLTQSDAVLGSAHYLAPETTRGEAATNQIDLYALGIVFYELLCGSVPFNGDNPVQIAMKHLREEVPSIREFNPTLPQSIENIITKATVKNRKLRYQSAGDMLADLYRCLLPEYGDVPKLILEDEINDPTVVLDNVKDTKKPAQPKQEDVVEEISEDVKPVKKGHGKLIIGILLAILLAGAITAGVYFSGAINSFSYNPAITIPDIVDTTQEEALSTLLAQGFKKENITFVETLSDDAEEGMVFACDPAIGETAHKNEQIKVSISNGNYYVIKDYKGEDIDEVSAELKEALPKIKISIEKTPSKDASVGTILSQSGAAIDTKADPNTEVNIYFKVASEPQVVIPDLIGKPIEEAKAELSDYGVAVVIIQELTYNMSEEEIEKLEKGVVVRVSPEVGTTYIQKGADSVITLYYY